MHSHCVLALLICALLVSGCEDKQQRALVALSERGYSLSVVEFLRGAKEGDGRVIELFLSAGLAVNVVDTGGRSALEVAAEAGNFPAVEALLNAHAVVKPINRVLYAAVQSGKMRVLRRILEQGVTPDATEPFVLLQAVKLSQREMVEALLPMCAMEVDRAMLLAAQQGDIEILDMLMHAGASHFYADPKSGHTALMEAVEQGRPETVDFLIRCGAYRFAADSEGQTAIDKELMSPGKKPHSKLLLALPTGDEKMLTAIWAKADVLTKPNDLDTGLPEVVFSAQLPQKGRDEFLKSGVKRLQGQIVSGDALLPDSLDDPTTYLSLHACHLAMLPCLLDSVAGNEAKLTFLDQTNVIVIKQGDPIPGTSWRVAELRPTPQDDLTNYPSWWWPNLVIRHDTSDRKALLLPHLPARVGELCAMIERTGDKTRYEAAVGDFFSTAIVSSPTQHEYVVESISSQKVVIRSRDKEGKQWIVTPNTGH